MRGPVLGVERIGPALTGPVRAVVGGVVVAGPMTRDPRTVGPAHSAYGATDAAAAWECRRRDLQDLGGIIDVLTDVERRTDELNRRAAELVEDWL